MFVRQMIGRQAGEIIEMRADAAQACLAQGSVARVTDEELAAAGMAPPPAPPQESLPAMADGYEARPRPDGLGFDVFATPVADGAAALNDAPLHNLAAARDFAATHAALQRKPADPAGIPEGWQDLKADEMKALAMALGADPAPSTKADAAAFIEAEVARRNAAQPQA